MSQPERPGEFHRRMQKLRRETDEILGHESRWDDYPPNYGLMSREQLVHECWQREGRVAAHNAQTADNEGPIGSAHFAFIHRFIVEPESQKEVKA